MRRTADTAARTEAEARARIIQDMLASGHWESSPDIAKSPNMQQLFQQKLRTERDIAELSATLLPAHPRMRQLKAQLHDGEEIAVLDVRHEAEFATAHPLFAANMAAGRIALEAEARLPRKDVPIVLFDDGQGLVSLSQLLARRR